MGKVASNGRDVDVNDGTEKFLPNDFISNSHIVGLVILSYVDVCTEFNAFSLSRYSLSTLKTTDK
jgi:hypothetical protein